jgi:hypothetical protein
LNLIKRSNMRNIIGNTPKKIRGLVSAHNWLDTDRNTVT